jgi:hypothetical protein
MATVNQYFQTGLTPGNTSEQNLYEDLIIESLQIYGYEVYYLPRTPQNYDPILTEDPLNKYENAYPLEMYMENFEGFQGDGELLTKFGLEIRDTANFIVSRKRWKTVVGDDGQSVLPTRPTEGDLIYFPRTKAFFEIKKVEGHTPFYQVGRLYIFKLMCELMQFSNERINTGITEIDEIAAGYDLSTNAFEIAQENGDTILSETNALTPIAQESYTVEKPSVGSMNDVFTNEKDSVLDFSENNPFGEP